MPSLVSPQKDVWKKSTEFPHWYDNCLYYYILVTTNFLQAQPIRRTRQIKVLTGHQHGISAVVTYTSYWGVRHFVGKTEVAPWQFFCFIQNVLLNNQRSNNLKYINKHLHENGDFYYFINLTTTKTTTLLTLSLTWIFQYQNNQYNNTWNNVK